MSALKPHRTQAERRETTRARILDAAVNELLSRGYAGFRVNDVARAAKVSRGARAHHFPTREALILETMRSLYKTSQAQSRQLIEGLQPGDDIFEALMSDSEAFYLGPTFLSAVKMISSEERPALWEDIRALAHNHRVAMEKAWLEALVRSGVPEKDALGIIYLTEAVFRGVVTRELLSDDSEYVRITLSRWRELARAQLARYSPRSGTPAGTAG